MIPISLTLKCGFTFCHLAPLDTKSDGIVNPLLPLIIITHGPAASRALTGFNFLEIYTPSNTTNCPAEDERFT